MESRRVFPWLIWLFIKAHSNRVVQSLGQEFRLGRSASRFSWFLWRGFVGVFDQRKFSEFFGADNLGKLTILGENQTIQNAW